MLRTALHLERNKTVLQLSLCTERGPTSKEDAVLNQAFFSKTSTGNALCLRESTSNLVTYIRTVMRTQSFQFEECSRSLSQNET